MKTKLTSERGLLAEVVPVLKEVDPEVPANNRPISLLLILSKIIERIAQRQFPDFSPRNNKLSVHQSGHKKRNSRETALIYVTDQFLKALLTKKNCITVSIKHKMTGPEKNS